VQLPTDASGNPGEPGEVCERQRARVIACRLISTIRADRSGFPVSINLESQCFRGFLWISRVFFHVFPFIRVKGKKILQHFLSQKPENPEPGIRIAGPAGLQKIFPNTTNKVTEYQRF